MKPMLLIAVLILSTTKVSHAQTDLADNAALVYWPAFSILQNDKDKILELTREPSEVVQMNRRLQLLLEEHADAIHMILRAEAMEHCDFGARRITFSTLNDDAYLRHVRFATNILAADAVRLIHDGNPEAGVARFQTALRVIDDTRSPGRVVERLVTASSVTSITRIANACLDADLLTPELLTPLAQQLAYCREPDAFRIVECVEGERQFVHDTVEDALSDHEMNLPDTRRIARLTVDDEAWESDEELVIPEDWRERVERNMRELDLFMDQLAVALNSDDPVGNAKAIEDRVNDGESGYFIWTMAPRLSTSYRLAEEARAEIVQLLDRIDSEQSPD